MEDNNKSTQQQLLISIINKFNFETGRYVSNDTYAPIQELLAKSEECDLLRSSLSIPRPKNIFENSPSDDLWKFIGGRNKEKEGALVDILQNDDIHAKNISIEYLLNLRRDITPRRDPILYIKAASELAARLKTDKEAEGKKINELLRRKYIRILERIARWRMIRKLQPEKT